MCVTETEKEQALVFICECMQADSKLQYLSRRCFICMHVCVFVYMFVWGCLFLHVNHLTVWESRCCVCVYMLSEWTHVFAESQCLVDGGVWLCRLYTCSCETNINLKDSAQNDDLLNRTLWMSTFTKSWAYCFSSCCSREILKTPSGISSFPYE